MNSLPATTSSSTAEPWQVRPRDYSTLSSIPYLDTPPTYHEFLTNYLEPNIPVLIGPKLTASWKARQEWVRTKDGKPDFENLRKQLCPSTTKDDDDSQNNIQSVEVPIADCAEKDFSDQKRSVMDLRQYLNEWETKSDKGEPCRLYLKDFHFVKTFPDYHAYDTPNIFRDDWMNEFWTRRKDMDDDYRFVYCGGDQTFTPFHADVYRSYSWSANICGTKQWTLFPPDQEHLWIDSLRNSVYDIYSVDKAQFPDFHTAKSFVIDQLPGQTLFVPSGWWHQVHNVGDTISINHNWSNGSNLDLLFQSFLKDLKDVERELEHLKEGMGNEGKEWIETCQRILLINSGWDWSTVWEMLTCIRKRVVSQMVVDDDKSTSLAKVQEQKPQQQSGKQTPLFEPPAIEQQPDLGQTLGRIDRVLDWIKNQESAVWFLKTIKHLEL